LLGRAIAREFEEVGHIAFAITDGIKPNHTGLNHLQPILVARNQLHALTSLCELFGHQTRHVISFSRCDKHLTHAHELKCLANKGRLLLVGLFVGSLLFVSCFAVFFVLGADFFTPLGFAIPQDGHVPSGVVLRKRMNGLDHTKDGLSLHFANRQLGRVMIGMADGVPIDNQISRHCFPLEKDGGRSPHLD
jgi:hypothetical protein